MVAGRKKGLCGLTFHLHKCASDERMKLLNNTGEPLCSASDHQVRGRRTPTVSAGALERGSRLFKAIGDVPRLRLLSLLAQGEACVTELAESEGDSISTISQRLRVLRNENLVVRKRRGKHINYALADQHVMDLVFNALAHASEHPPLQAAPQEEL
jgi:ArsR family transcriptional regulator, lead/cadmium/zinc/bismuth-responsive transcriptional repressor